MCIDPATLLEERQLTYTTLSAILYLLDDIKRTRNPEDLNTLTEEAIQLCIKLRYHYSQLVPDPKLNGGVTTPCHHQGASCAQSDRVDILEMFCQDLSEVIVVHIPKSQGSVSTTDD